jgi:hypothetical protein
MKTYGGSGGKTLYIPKLSNARDRMVSFRLMVTLSPRINPVVPTGHEVGYNPEPA